MDDYGKSSIGNQLCIDLVTTTSPSTSSSASSSTSSPTSPLSQESPSLCNIRFHREHSEPSIIINNNKNNNNNNNTPTSQNANLTNNTQEMIKPIISSNKKSYMTSNHPQRHYSNNNNNINKKTKKPTIDTKRTTITAPTTLLSPYQPSPPVRYNNVYRFYNGGGINNYKSADFAMYDNPDRTIPTDKLALFMRNKRRYFPPNFKPIPPSPGGWTDVVPERTVAWELTCENYTDTSPFLRLRALDGPLEMPWKPTATITTPNTTSAWSSPFQPLNRQQQQQQQQQQHQQQHQQQQQQQQQQLRRDDMQVLHHKPSENGASSTSSSETSTTQVVSLSPPSSSSHPSLPSSSSSTSTSLLSSQYQVYVSTSRSNNHYGEMGTSTKEERSILPTKNKKNVLSPLDTNFSQLLNPPATTYSTFQSTTSNDSIQELPGQAVQHDTSLQRIGWTTQQQRHDSHLYSHACSTSPTTLCQQQQDWTSFEPLSPPPIDLTDHPSRNKIGPVGSPCSLFSSWGISSPPPPSSSSSSSSSTWLRDISSSDEPTSLQQRRSSSFAREYNPTTVASSFFRTRSSSLGIVRPSPHSQQRRPLQQKDDSVASSTLWKFQPLLSPTATTATESTSSSSSSSSSSFSAWPLWQQQQQHYYHYHHQPPTPDDIFDQRGKRSSTSDIAAWQHPHHQQQQQLQQQLQQWTLSANNCTSSQHGNSRPLPPSQNTMTRDMDDRSISILRVLDADSDSSTATSHPYSLFSKPVVKTSNKKNSSSSSIDNHDNNNNNSNAAAIATASASTSTSTTTTTNHPLHHQHHRLYYNISDYVVVSDA